MASILDLLGRKAVERYRAQYAEVSLLEVFILQGPAYLKKALKVYSNQEWQLFFDYLVLEKKVFSQCIRLFPEFFVDFMVQKGPKVLSKALQVSQSKYNGIFEGILDYIGIAQGALYKHVENHIAVYAKMIREGKGSLLRNRLCLQSANYDSVWYEIVELIQDEICTKVMDERIVEQALKSWTLMVNTTRFPRGLS